MVPGSGQQLMYVVGVGEIVAHRRRRQAALGRLPGGSLARRHHLNLLTYSGWYDIALRGFGLMLGALMLSRLAPVYDAPFVRR